MEFVAESAGDIVVNNTERRKTIPTSLAFWRYNVRTSDWEHFAVCEKHLVASAMKEMSQNHPYEIIVHHSGKPKLPMSFMLG